jgi:phosphatidylserine/phosphatidylglycerophosphate/cardiolipin synthase-like enzyme
LTEEEIDMPNGPKPEKDGGNDNSEVAAVVVGSSNFGYRSFYRDMESNLLLVFPPGSSPLSPNDGSNDDIASSFGEEWKNLLASSKREVVEEDNLSSVQEGKMGRDTAEKAPPLPWPILKSPLYQDILLNREGGKQR